MKAQSSQIVCRIALAIVALHTALLGWGAYRQSPTYNEVAHLVAGVSYWQFGRFDVYRVNPPLTRLVAAVPVVMSDPKTDWKSFYESPGARPEFEMGKDFVAANGERSLWLYTIARWACIPFSWLGAWICFRWARELYGSAAGLLALALWCFEPNILAHAQLITPDAGATALGLAASYYFWHWLKQPAWSWTFITGGALGLAELAKFTWLILFVLWPALWIVWRLTDSKSRSHLRRWVREGLHLGFILLLGLYVINLGYGFEGSFQPLRKFQFVSCALAETRTFDGHTVLQPGTNRFAKSRFGGIPVPLPSNFAVGLDLQKKDLEHFPRKSYLRGEFRDRGWWYYYLYASAIKIPLGIWSLALLALSARLLRPMPGVGRDAIVVLAPAILIVAIASAQSGLNDFRYILPALPFAFVWTSGITRRIICAHFWLAKLTAGGVVWTVASSLWIYPHSLSYFNETAGGPNGGSSHLLDSSPDWGQDLIFLRVWTSEHPGATPVRLIYHGYFDPQAVSAGFRFPTEVLDGADPQHASRYDREIWYAVSVSILHGASFPAPVGDGRWAIVSPTMLQPLLAKGPDAQAGYSILIFHATRPLGRDR